MSSQQNDDLAQDDIAEHAYGRLAAAWDPQQQAVTDDEDREVRKQIEAVAMLAFSLEPEAPSVSAKDRLMATVASTAQQAIPLPAAPTVISPMARDSRDPVDRTLQHAVAAAAPISTHAPAPPQTPSPSPATVESPGDRTLIGYDNEQGSNVVPFAPRQAAGWTTMALAAALAFCLVGLGYLYSELSTQNAVLAVQKDRLAEMPRLEEQLDDSRTQLRAMNERLAMVNTVARQAYPLHTTEASVKSGIGDEETFGRVFVCGQHQRWYLTVSGLEPAPSGQDYHLWYMTEHGPVDAGVVEIEGGVAGLQNLSMPDDTQGFRLTLESDEVSDVPRGRTILVGESPVKL